MSAHETPAGKARNLIRRARSAALATLLDADGSTPYASFVEMACDPGGRPILLLSNLAQHTANLAENSKASLLVETDRGTDQPGRPTKVVARPA